jgi:hypothetical protein
MAGIGKRLPAADRLVTMRRMGTLLGFHRRSRPPLIGLRVRLGSARTVAGREKHDFDLSSYTVSTYFWRWNNRNRISRRISLVG